MAAREPDPVTDPLCDADPLARALAKLRPAPTGLDAQRLLFLAGQAERDRSVTFWRRTSIVQLAALVAFGGAYLLTTSLHSAAPDHKATYTSRPTPEAPAPAPGGPAAVPAPQPEPEPPVPDRYQGIPQGFARAEPGDLSPEDRARWLALRNDVLAAGLGLLPSSPRADRPSSWDQPFVLPRDVFASPLYLPEPKAPSREPDLPED